jgi:hypothetical protein
MTTFSSLYSQIGTIVTAATNRKWWRKGGMQATPREPYATIFLDGGNGVEHDVVETVNSLIGFDEIPWNASRVGVRVEFFRGDALGDASRFRSALQYDQRFSDLWDSMGLAGPINIIDISGAFRADIEQRAEVRFSGNANLAGDAIIADNSIQEIETININVTHVKSDESETDIVVAIENTEN